MDARVAEAQAWIGQTLKGKWHVEALLGIGATASVFAATHRNGNRVAIKLLHAHFAVNEDVRKRFVGEGYMANRIRHPGTVTVHDDDVTDGGQPFLVLDLLEGQSVADWMQVSARPMSPGAVLALVDQILETLGCAHRAGIIHRDVKPENFFITTTGTVKLLDFGLARGDQQQRAKRRMTLKGVSMGTPAFMPPEQARGAWDEVDARSDVWALGASMFFLLSGRPVHDAENIGTMVTASASTPAPALGSVAPDVPEAVKRVVDRALSFSKHDRFRDAEQMRRAVRAAMVASEEPCNVPVAHVTIYADREPVSGDTMTIPSTMRSDPPARYSEPPRMFAPSGASDVPPDDAMWSAGRVELGSLAPRWEQLSKELLKGARVLIVDDEPSVRMVLEQALATEGFTVVSVDSAEAALTQLQEQRFDLVVTDKNMAGVSGLELIGRARALTRELPIALITGYASTESIEEALGAGAVDYITKPFRDLGHLTGRLGSIIYRRVLALVYDVMIDDLIRLTEKVGHDAPDIEQLLVRLGSEMDARPQVMLLAGPRAEFVKAPLEAAGVGVVTVASRRAFLDALRGPDGPLVAIVDLDGVGAQFLIRDAVSADPLVEVLAVTRETSVDDSLRAVSAGATDFVLAREGTVLLTRRAERLADKARNRRTVIGVVRELYRIARQSDAESAERLLNAVPPAERSAIRG